MAHDETTPKPDAPPDTPDTPDTTAAADTPDTPDTTAAADTPEAPDTPETSEDQAAGRSAAAEAARLEEKWLRAVADLDNARKRYARELRNEVEAERRRTCLAWLPVLDNLELALQHAADREDPVVIGVRAVRDQAVALLESLGYPRDDEVEVPFDPVRHEVVGTLEDTGLPPGTVVQVLRPGYGIPPDRQLRAAAVMVGREPG